MCPLAAATMRALTRPGIRTAECQQVSPARPLGFWCQLEPQHFLAIEDLGRVDVCAAQEIHARLIVTPERSIDERLDRERLGTTVCDLYDNVEQRPFSFFHKTLTSTTPSISPL